MSREIIYVGDPMCSWCWGFAPVLEAIRQDYADTVPMRVIVGGLHTGDSNPMSDETKRYIRHHWEQVNQATGQPFTFDFFDRDGFVLDTEPSCRAVVTMRGLRPAATLPFFERLHRAFYVENADTTSPALLASLAPEFDVPEAEFATAFASPKVKSETLGDFRLSQRLGVRGFPTVLLRRNQQLAMLTAGYRPLEDIKPALDGWLQSTGAPAQPSLA